MARDFYLVSSPFSNGVAWLVNVLMELGIRCDHSSFGEAHWDAADKGDALSGQAYDLLRWHLPVVYRKSHFRFDASIRIIWEHRLDFAKELKPTILYVRDPRDAIYSYYRREYSQAPFPEYLKSAETYPSHFPCCFRLPPADTWAYFYMYWMMMQEFTDLIAVKFEDMRRSPVEEVKRVLEFMGVSRSEEEIREALEYSTFERAKEGMKKAEAETGKVRLTARAGKVEEWREVFTPEALECFSGPAARAMKAFGYEAAAQAEERSACSFINYLDDDVCRLLFESQSRLRRGDFPGSSSSLAGALQLHDSRASQKPVPEAKFILGKMEILNRLTSLYWVYAIFGDSHISSVQAYRSFTFFRDLNERFMGHDGFYDSLRYSSENMIDVIKCGASNLSKMEYAREIYSYIHQLKYACQNRDYTESTRLSNRIQERMSFDPEVQLLASKLALANDDTTTGEILTELANKFENYQQGGDTLTPGDHNNDNGARPNIIFSNFQCSGASAIDPILRDILPPTGYDLIPCWPHTPELFPMFIGWASPLYYWTHSSTRFFEPILKQGDYKFLYLYRDPRDVLVSVTKDLIFKGEYPAGSERMVMMNLIEQALHGWLEGILEWRRLDGRQCFCFTFEEMKKDVPGMVQRILQFLEIPMDEKTVRDSSDRWSFEAVTKRRRGDEGPTVRNQYMFRKGISGDWKNYFDESMIKRFKEIGGPQMLEIGYPIDSN